MRMKMSEEPRFIIHAPNGMTYKECAICKNPMVYDGENQNCVFCSIAIFDKYFDALKDSCERDQNLKNSESGSQYA